MYPDIGQRPTPFEHQPGQVGDSIKDATYPTSQPFRAAEVLRTIPQKPAILAVQSEPGLHPNINGQEYGHAALRATGGSRKGWCRRHASMTPGYSPATQTRLRPERLAL